jgi:DNA-directed RNA polymerase subunit RPC12/RpoP
MKKTREDERYIPDAEWDEKVRLHQEIEAVPACEECGRRFAHNHVRVLSLKDRKVRCQRCSRKGK